MYLLLYFYIFFRCVLLFYGVLLNVQDLDGVGTMVSDSGGWIQADSSRFKRSWTRASRVWIRAFFLGSISC